MGTSYLDWKNAHDTPAAGIRANSGIIQAKNKGGSWVDITAWARSGTNVLPANLATDTVVAGTLSCTFLGATGVIAGNTISGTDGVILNTLTAQTLSVTSVEVSGTVTALEADLVGANLQTLKIAQLSELTTIAASVSSDTTMQIPANCIVLGVGGIVTETITTAATFSVEGATSVTTFSAAVAVAQGTTFSAMLTCPYLNLTAQKIRIRPDAQPADAAGRVRLVVNYIQITAPTN